MSDQPCEQFGDKRAAEIHALIQAATGKPCPGALGADSCPLGHCEPARHLGAVV